MWSNYLNFLQANKNSKTVQKLFIKLVQTCLTIHDLLNKFIFWNIFLSILQYYGKNPRIAILKFTVIYFFT
jgi:hypothetical protein